MSGAAARPRVCVISPCLNEEAVLPAFIARIAEVAAQLPGYDWELLLVDDGSSDATPDVIRAATPAGLTVRGVFLSRNVGQQRAITAGLDFCDADYAIIIDSDLQDPPELIPAIVAQLEAGFQVVHTAREDRSVDPPLKRLSAAAFYALMRRCVLPDLPYNAGDYKGLDRQALDAMRQYGERVRFLRGLFATLGFRQTVVPFRRAARYRGDSKYPWWKVLRLARDAVFSNTVWPLRIGLILGGGFIVLTPVILIWAFTFRSMLLYGLQTAMISFIGGVVLCLLGFIGEYLKVITLEVKQRPLYLVRAVHGFPPGQAKTPRN
jgi:glycosyltransferase involved in cell wall biosynthesis